MLVLPSVPRGRKPPGLTTADVVRANCARLGLPVPAILLSCSGGSAEDVMRGGRGGLGTASVRTTQIGEYHYYPSGAVVQVPVAAQVIGTGELTIAAVVNPDSFAAARAICSWGAFDPAFVLSNVTGRPYIYDYTTKTSATNGPVVGEWNSIVAGRSGTGTSQGFYYLNGAPSGTFTWPESVSLASTMNIASDRTTASYPLVGGLAQLAVWNTALTGGQVEAWSARWPQLLAPAPRRLWFDLGAATSTFRAAWLAGRHSHIIGGGL